MLRAIRAWIGRPNSGIWFSVATVMVCRQSVIRRRPDPEANITRAFKISVCPDLDCG